MFYIMKIENYWTKRQTVRNFSDKEILEEVLKHLRTMRDTWKEVMVRAKQK